MSPLHILLALYATSAVGLGWLIWCAPDGWQDRDGFHRGREPVDDAGCQQTNAGFVPQPFSHSPENSRERQRDHA